MYFQIFFLSSIFQKRQKKCHLTADERSYKITAAWPGDFKPYSGSMAWRLILTITGAVAIMLIQTWPGVFNSPVRAISSRLLDSKANRIAGYPGI
jgi:hypothetical protein